MKGFASWAPIIIGVFLLLYIFTFGAISSNHSIQSYLVLCTGIMSINLGLLAFALTSSRK